MKKIKFKKISFRRDIRRGLVVLFCIMMVFSICITAVAYQKDTTADETVDVYTYSQSGLFDFTFNLGNNSVYNKTSIKPEQDVVFRKIVDSIDASFTYAYRGDEDAETRGEYLLKARVVTDLWEKEYTLAPKTEFVSTTSTANFTVSFPINITFYENVVVEINDEIGIRAKDPVLSLNCKIIVHSDYLKGIVYDSFSHSLNISLYEDVIEFDGDFFQSVAGSRTGMQQVFLQNVIDERNMWSIASVSFFMLFICFVFGTGSIVEQRSRIEKMFRKIKKKYGDRIVETGEVPTIAEANTIVVRSFDDLMKASEELGKPVIQYTPTENQGEKQMFYVFDETVNYKYEMPNGEKVKRVAICPQCQSKNIYEAYPGEKVLVTCPNCGNKGIVSSEQECQKKNRSTKKAKSKAGITDLVKHIKSKMKKKKDF